MDEVPDASALIQTRVIASPTKGAGSASMAAEMNVAAQALQAHAR
jgi:hypothetical protein